MSCFQSFHQSSLVKHRLQQFHTNSIPTPFILSIYDCPRFHSLLSCGYWSRVIKIPPISGMIQYQLLPQHVPIKQDKDVKKDMQEKMNGDVHDSAAAAAADSDHDEY